MIIPLYTYIFTDQLFDFLVHSFLNLIDILLFRPDLFQMWNNTVAEMELT